MAQEPASLLDVAGGLMSDPAEKAAFAADPQGYVERLGLDDFSPAELHDALGFVADSLPAPLAAQLGSIQGADGLDGIDAIVQELGQVASIDPGAVDDLGLGEDPLDGFDAGVDLDSGAPGGLDHPLDPTTEPYDDAGDLLDHPLLGGFSSNDAGDDASFGEGSVDGSADVGEPEAASVLDDQDPSGKLIDGSADAAFEPDRDPTSGLDDSFGNAVPPVNPLGDEEEEPEDAFDETDFDDSVDI